jgi:hypothetical protein
LGVHEGRAIYLLYNGILRDRSIAGGNVLTGPVFDALPKFAGPKVIYAAANRMGARSSRESIVFTQTPYALEVTGLGEGLDTSILDWPAGRRAWRDRGA